ncbi:hypothetical protein [Methanosarcina sp. KYL-1]|uniref:hypothetical protein n=1 Tax=Methanosarcina sp. KYL-1 TaxID=2602068 RepID=UPI0021008CC0|nr:hypothetical protein [Methanosarcina sp. KYL-1]
MNENEKSNRDSQIEISQNRAAGISVIAKKPPLPPSTPPLKKARPPPKKSVRKLT